MTAIKSDRNFTVQDPRNFDGDAYQVAQRAIQQMNGLVALALEQVEPVTIMVRNADLDRTTAEGGSLGDAAAEWPESPQGRQLRKVQEQLENVQRKLKSLELAASYNPKAA